MGDRSAYTELLPVRQMRPIYSLSPLGVGALAILPAGGSDKRSASRRTRSKTKGRLRPSPLNGGEEYEMDRMPNMPF